MDKKIFHNLIETLDKEIDAYSKLKDLFEEKKEILKQSKADELGNVDNRIIALNNEITKLNKKREEISFEILGENANMSRFIQFSKDAFAPQGCNYNGAGKTDTHDIDMWTINEEV